MRTSKILLVAFVSLIAVEAAHAQRSRNVTRSRYHFSTPKVRGNKAKIICPTFDKSKYPFHGLGFKFGDPFAITYKFYPNKKISMAVDVGKAASGLYNRYFREKFASYVSRDTFPDSGSALVYINHRVKSDVIVEAKVLYHVVAKSISEGLQVYAGAGWEWKRTRLRYDYQYSADAGDPQISDPFGSFSRNRVTMGPQLVVGIEYAY